MKLQIKFLLLLLVSFVTIGSLLVVQRSFDLQRSKSVLANELSQRKSLLNASLTSEGRTFQTFSEDYSFWDDMVAFVKTGNLKFAQTNLDSGLGTFGADADWVYRPNGTLLYSSKADPSVSVDTLTLPPQFFRKLTADKFEHFYTQLPGGTLEVRAATIVPGNDADHLSAPAGYWIVGRFLGADFTSNINNLSQSSISLKPASGNSGDKIDTNTVTFSKPLQDWQGQTVEQLSAISHVTVIDDLNVLYKRELILLLMISAAMLALVAGAIWWLVLRPVRLISLSIQKQQPAMLDTVSKSHSQFGDLARTVQQFFAQKNIILEDQFKKAELERLNKDKAGFLALAAHELKGPIAIVKLLSEDMPHSLPDTKEAGPLRRNLEIITHQVRKMSTLISDLRLASEGKEDATFNPIRIEFDSFLQKEVTEMGFIINQKIIFEGSTGKHVVADADRLSQVVSNLIRNAAKYSPDADKIMVRSSVNDETVVIEIEDFGVGISPEDQAHIFERFFRAPSVASTFQGLGLGLSITKGIIDHMGGNIWVKSTPGVGSHFYFSLPIAGLRPTGVDAIAEPKIGENL